uniref:Uncharacterized protein n=1 Tax=Setaria italica TaxID=4555 RepID=K3Z1K6_SETIT
MSAYILCFRLFFHVLGFYFRKEDRAMLEKRIV